MKCVCAVSGKEFEVTNEDLVFYEKMGVPLPTLCPEERMRRRLAWRHGGKLFEITCAGTQKKTISMYSDEKKFPIYEQKYWWSDNWNGKDYGKDFDFSRPFFDQFKELLEKVPRISLVNTNSVNSYYTSHGLNLKNCYLIVGGVDSEDCLYGFFIQNCRDVVDSISLVDCELCFSGNASIGCYECSYFSHCRNCSDCFLIQDCHACKDCLACVGLTQKQYYILNKSYSKEDYEKIKAECCSGKRSDLEKIIAQFESLKQTVIYPFSHQYNCEDCTGDMLFHCQKCQECFDCKETERCKYVSFTPKGLQSYDSTFTAPAGVQFSYENVSTQGNNMMGNALVWRGADIFYSVECHNSADLFGCISLKKSQYCILNKQYSKEEYFVLRNKIINHMKITGEWGEFFPISMAPFAYNESFAEEYFPMKKEEALARGYDWGEEETSNYKTSNYDIPDNIVDVPDSITKEVLACKTCGKNYQIQKQELKFYRKMRLPIPQNCSVCRHKKLLNVRNPRVLYTRTCDNCFGEMKTTFAPNRPEKVFCEKCYLEEVE